MKKPRINFTVIKEDRGYSAGASVGNNFITTDGNTFEELKANILEAVNLSFEDKGFLYDIDEIIFTYDLQSFFDFYKVINVKVLSERIGMNQSLLAQYIKGLKTPSPKQTKRILKGIRQIGKELSEVRLLPK
ncbi:MAG TPA: hypothetical protein PLN06_06180 [Bacteroidales bacterium]|nr:hypothetical protein [Bacteroidales bacterium]HOU96200.1 hypothetical protein [Bacteroidales bacterium]HQG36048.1 hypothetical protein [Bacteroidales bacterium]HQG52810.1 hypothetical protein [Bacteroidales bacterium]HQJ20827.1 hypothetical protein [Bacteroidales bacterium]